MMDIKHLRGENFCQYEVINQPFYPGLTCLLGLNGTGKSNMVRAIYLCLVGEVYGTSNLVRDGHRKGFVELDIGVPEGMITVTRKLTHNEKTRGTSIGHELKADWLDTTLDKKADVAAFLAPYLGVTSHALENVAFALQGEFDNLMMADHMPRARMLNALMGLERAEKLRDTLDKSIKLLADLPDRTEQIDHLKAQITLDEPKLQQAEATLVAAEARMTEQVKQSYAQARTTLAKQDDSERNRLLEAQRTLRATFVAEHAGKTHELAQIPEASVTTAPDTAAYTRYRDYLTTKESLAVAKDKLEKLRTEAPAEVSPISAELNKEVQDLHAETAKLREKLQSYGTGVCPTCNRAYDEKLDVAALQAEFDQKLAVYDSKATELNAQSDAYAKYTSALALHTGMYNSCDAQITTLETRLETLKDVADFDADAYNVEMQAYADSLNNASKRDKVNAEINRISANINNCDLEITRLEGMDVATTEQRTLAQSMVAAYNSVEATITAAKNERDQVAAAINSAKQRIDMLSADMAQAETNKNCREMLQFARDQLHAEKLPRLAAQGSIQTINKAMVKYLDMFAFPYGFRLDENCDFVVDLHTSPGHDAAILSGGERVRAALAMRFALMDVFSAGCGFLIIDEPTTALDSDAVTALVEVLSTAAAYFKTRNIKILCPTHAPQLSAVADTLITLGD